MAAFTRAGATSMRPALALCTTFHAGTRTGLGGAGFFLLSTGAIAGAAHDPVADRYIPAEDQRALDVATDVAARIAAAAS